MLLDLHPFKVRIKSDIPALARDIGLMYADFEAMAADNFADFHVEVAFEPGLRRWVKPMARFYFDGTPSFVPLPATQAFAMLEWGINWCIAAHSHHFLVIHAAVVEKNGKAAVLPAPPGSGKSTLCAALVLRGWRLLSDELGLYDTTTGKIYGMSRPVNLKNNSIAVIQSFEPDVVMTAAVPNTTKGTIALMRPPTGSVVLAKEPIRADWIILPKYLQGSAPELTPYGRAQTFMLLAEQSFNYDIHGKSGFDAFVRLVDGADCHCLTYSKLDDAIQIFDRLLAEVKT